MELLLKNAKLLDAKGERMADIWIRDGKIAEVGQDLVRPGKAVDLTGKLVLPGLVDLHVHLREPGQEGKETIATDRKSTRLNSSHVRISYAVFCLKKKMTCVCDCYDS